MARVEVITGVERRRRWSVDEKRAIVAESFAPGAVVAEVARRADISPGQIYRWRQEVHAAVAGFAPLLIAAPEAVESTAGPQCHGEENRPSSRRRLIPPPRGLGRMLTL